MNLQLKRAALIRVGTLEIAVNVIEYIVSFYILYIYIYIYMLYRSYNFSYFGHCGWHTRCKYRRNVIKMATWNLANDQHKVKYNFDDITNVKIVSQLSYNLI